MAWRPPGSETCDACVVCHLVTHQVASVTLPAQLPMMSERASIATFTVREGERRLRGQRGGREVATQETCRMMHTVASAGGARGACRWRRCAGHGRRERGFVRRSRREERGGTRVVLTYGVCGRVSFGTQGRGCSWSRSVAGRRGRPDARRAPHRPATPVAPRGTRGRYGGRRGYGELISDVPGDRWRSTFITYFSSRVRVTCLVCVAPRFSVPLKFLVTYVSP